MDVIGYGNPIAEIVLIQLAGDHDIGTIKNEYDSIKENTGRLLIYSEKTGDMGMVYYDKNEINLFPRFHGRVGKSALFCCSEIGI